RAWGRLSGRLVAPWLRGSVFSIAPSAGVRPARLSGRTPRDRAAFLYQQLPTFLRNAPIETRVQVLKKRPWDPWFGTSGLAIGMRCPFPYRGNREPAAMVPSTYCRSEQCCAHAVSAGTSVP